MCCLEGRGEEGESESESVLVEGVDEVWECVGEQVKVKERDVRVSRRAKRKKKNTRVKESNRGETKVAS